ncbi:glutathione S-transferase [Burkholderia sp. Ch1-1]|nr:glutathione S-transferase [Burkholderia sp. Ch1-1]
MTGHAAGGSPEGHVERMSADCQSTIEVSGYRWIPASGYGLARDLRVRWALEELGLPYRMCLFDPRKDAAVPAIEHPFGQIPALVDGGVHLFETGAICLYLAEKSDILLPRDAPDRARVLSWSVAALNTIEPLLLQFQLLNMADHRKTGAAQFVSHIEGRARLRLRQLTAALESREWLADRFTIADLLMVHVLTPLTRNAGLMESDVLSVYVARGMARPAFQRALKAQIADYAST